MYNGRMQILISPEQRRCLQDEARASGASVAALVREAIDQRFGRQPPREERGMAARRITARQVRMPPPEELRELIDSRFEGEHSDLTEKA